MKDSENLSLGEGYFVQYHAPEFGTYRIQDEELHPKDRTAKPHYALTETQYYGFYVPEQKIHCFTWIWSHPNLGSVTGGTMAWRGVKKHNLGCELFDFRNYMSMKVFDESFMSFKLDTGLEIEMTDPGRRFHLRYDDPARKNSFDVVQTAVNEPMVWPTSNHFEQVMRCEGEICLRGQTYAVDCYSVRDRSFGEYRLEDPMPIPPNSWVTAVFDEGFSFCVVGMDHPDLDPIWKDKFDVPISSTLRFGWMIVDGKKSAVRESRTKIEYDMDNLLPKTIKMTITDDQGRVHDVSGEIIAATPMTSWLNVRCPICLVAWECNGKPGIGEVQNVQFNDFVYAFS